jgi:hypothetical protein
MTFAGISKTPVEEIADCGTRIAELAFGYAEIFCCGAPEKGLEQV